MTVEQTDPAQPAVQDPAPAAALPPATTPATTAAPTPAAPPPPAVAPPPPSGPWAADLATRFPDEAVRGQVDTYLRETVQPHVTKLEQASQPANELYDAFKSNPDGAFAQIAKELYGDEEAKAITDYLESLDEAPDPEPAPQTASRTSSRFALEPEPAPVERDPEVQALIDADKAQKAQAAYDASFARVAAANPDLAIDRELFAPFAARASTLDNAVVNYRAYVAKLNAKYAEPGAPVAPAPPTLGNEAAGATAPPTLPQKQTLNEAIDAHFDFTSSDGTPVAPPIP